MEHEQDGGEHAAKDVRLIERLREVIGLEAAGHLMTKFDGPDGPDGPDDDVIARIDQSLQHNEQKWVFAEARFGSIEHRLDGIDVRLDGIDVRLDGIDIRLDSLETKVDSGFERMDHQFRRIDEKFDRMDAKFDAKFDRFDAKFDGLTFHVNRMAAIAIVSNVLAVLTATGISLAAS